MQQQDVCKLFNVHDKVKIDCFREMFGVNSIHDIVKKRQHFFVLRFFKKILYFIYCTITD